MRRVCLIAIATLFPAALDASEYQVGVARIDVTPEHPIRLNGFGFRRTESEGVTQPIHAKALAIEDEGKEIAVLITVDVLGIPDEVRREIAKRLAKKGVQEDRLAITATHTHTGPMLKDANPTLFGVPIPKQDLANIDRYTAVFVDKLEKVALEALAKREPAKLSWGIGKVSFAINRRTKTGPVDHDLPVLFIKDKEGKVRAVHVTYACHCVTLSDNKISGDWAGYAQEAIERVFAGSVALVSIGCGADSNPSSGVTGAKSEVAALQGAEIASEVQRLAKGFLAPVKGNIAARAKTIELPLAKLPGRGEWEEKAKRKDAIGHHARIQLEKLDRKEALPDKVAYRVQTWAFGDSLAMVFLPGEVVVDYALRLKRELDAQRLWINAYANDDPCYIASERVLKEGGYEGGGAMIYYDLPGPFKPGLEQPIIDAVKEQIGKTFAAKVDVKKTHGSLPLSPQQSLATLRVHAKLAVELVAAEPLVASPVAIEFGPDGKLWVVEMLDYPSGRGGKFEPGGRVRYLEDSDGDGFFDTSTTFLEGIPFPTGITVWRKGVLVCAAPDILYAEDKDGDGKADVVRKLFSGFGTENFQARVNSLSYGLDGWVYGACGLFGGKIECFTIDGKKAGTVALGNRDFRINPDLGLLEPVMGLTQQGRVRDDWGNWFGCDNSTLIRHYVLTDHYLKRNPHVPSPAASVLVADGPNPNRLFPARSDIQLFKLSGPAGFTTAACGLGIYRDDLLGPEFQSHSFTCEPVNLLVHRLRLAPKGSTFSGRRFEEEKEAEFLAGTDTWFRPVQARTGPDGCLWVVDMYRFVIEHPRWIPKEDLAELDVRAGAGMGRIYRVVPKAGDKRPWPRLDKLDTRGLAAALDSANGWQRDLAMQMLLWNPDKTVTPAVRKMAEAGKRPEARLHALAVLAGWDALSVETLRTALSDAHPGVSRQAARWAERHLEELGPALAKLADDGDAQVRLQAAYSLASWQHPRAAETLATLLLRHADDPFLTAAALSSVNDKNLAGVVTKVIAAGDKQPSLARKVLGLAGTMGDDKVLEGVFDKLLAADKDRFAPWQMAGLAGVLDASERGGRKLDKLPAQTLKSIDKMLDEARRVARLDEPKETEHLAAILLLGRRPERLSEDLKTLARFLLPVVSPTLQKTALEQMARSGDQAAAGHLIKGWRSYSPAVKNQVLETLLSRLAWQEALLDALAARTIPLSEIDVPRRQRLQSQKDPKIRARATKLLEGGVDADRQRVLADYQAALKLKGDALKGKEVFATHCAACHRLAGAGETVGPDLAMLADRTPQYLLTEILDPNRNLDSRFLTYLASLKDGRVITGVIASETATTILLRGGRGEQEEFPVLRADLDELASSGRSFMPEGLEGKISHQAMADLLAFLTAPNTSRLGVKAP